MTTHYSKVTKKDYAEAAFKKVKKIHEELPTGDILVFLTGKKEIKYLCQRLKLELNKSEEDKDEAEQESSGGENVTDKKQGMKALILPLYS